MVVRDLLLSQSSTYIANISRYKSNYFPYHANDEKNGYFCNFKELSNFNCNIAEVFALLSYQKTAIKTEKEKKPQVLLDIQLELFLYFNRISCLENMTLI